MRPGVERSRSSSLENLPDSSSGPNEGDRSSNLFRPEALAAATSRFGSPIRPIGLNTTILTGFLLMILVGVSAFLASSSYTRKETVPGVVQPSAGSARVATLSPGVISEVFVAEGQYVEAGMPILQFTSDPSVAANGTAPRALSRLIDAASEREARALTAQSEAQVQENLSALEDLRARESGLQADQAELGRSLKLQHERVRLARETYDAGRALNDRQLFSTLQLRQREEALIAAEQGVGSLERALRQNDASLEQLRAEARRLQAQMHQARAEMQRAQAQFDQRRAEQLVAQASVLVASRSGRVAALQARPGTLVQAGQTLATILPKGERLQVELWTPSRAAGFVEIGAPVRLMYDAFPYQKFGVGRGRVVSIAGAPTNPIDLTVPIESNEALYRVVVELESETVEGYGRNWRLTPGMRLSADLVLDERSLWEWLLDPLIAARRRSVN